MSSENAVTSIKVRMYRQGFGDCFLLSFYSDDDRVFTMLIDCGIKYNQDAPIEEVIADLRANLTPEGEENPKLDVLVATHEHWDHIAYFHPTRFPNYFKDFEIGRVWLAWTEDPDDPEAKTINSRLREGAVALHLAAAQLEDAEKDEKKQSKDMRFGGEVADARSKFNQSMDDVLGFYGADLKDANAMKEQMFGAKEVSESGIRY